MITIIASLLFCSTVVIATDDVSVATKNDTKPTLKTTGKPVTPVVTAQIKVILDAKNRVEEFHFFTLVDGVFNYVDGGYYFYDVGSEIGHFYGNFLPGTKNVTANYGSLKATGPAFKQAWTPSIGSCDHLYNTDEKNNIVSYSYVCTPNNAFVAFGPDLPIVTKTFCSGTFQQCTGSPSIVDYFHLPSTWIPSKTPTSPLTLNDAVFNLSSSGVLNGTADVLVGPNPNVFHLTGVGPALGGTIIGGYEFAYSNAPLETGYYGPTSIAVNSKTHLILISEVKAISGNNAGVSYAVLSLFSNGNQLADTTCAGHYDKAGNLVLSSASDCTAGYYYRSQSPSKHVVKRVLGYIDKKLIKLNKGKLSS